MVLYKLLLIMLSLISALVMIKAGVNIKSLFYFFMPIVILLMYWAKDIRTKTLNWREFCLLCFLGLYGYYTCTSFYEVWVKGGNTVSMSAVVGGFFGALVALSFYPVRMK